MQQPKVFQYATTLDIYMLHYTIKISPTSQDMPTIVTKFGKSEYNRLSMGMCALGDIFQAKVEKLLSDIKGAKTYIYDILVLSKEILSRKNTNWGSSLVDCA